jgi:hypothetical protein
VLRAGECAVLAAYALIGIDLGDSVFNVDSVVTANLCALTAAEASGVAKVESLEVKFSCFVAGGDSHLLKLVVCSSVSGAFNECNGGLESCKIMECIYDDLLFALNGTCNAANALVIVDDSVVVYDMYSVFRAVLFAGSAGDASISAGSSYDLFVLFCG